MQDLTGQNQAPLVPSSMNAGNTTAGDPKIAMTAPGSLSVLPVPDRMDVLPMPRFTNATAIPVSHPGMQKRAPVAQPTRDGSIPWKDMHDVPKGSKWKETS